MARGGGGHGGGHWGGYGGGFRGGYVGGFRHYGYGGGGFFIGFPYSYPYYSYPPYYSSSAVTMPSIPPVYIEQGTVPKVQALESNKWDYCANPCLLYTSPSPRDRTRSRMPSSA